MFDCVKVAFLIHFVRLRMTAIEVLFFPSILQISDASDSDLASIAFESEFLQLMCEAGEIRVVTVSNFEGIIQIVYENQTNNDQCLICSSRKKCFDFLLFRNDYEKLILLLQIMFNFSREVQLLLIM